MYVYLKLFHHNKKLIRYEDNFIHENFVMKYVCYTTHTMEDILSDVPSITISLFIMRGGDPKYLEDYCKLSMSLGKYQKYNNNTIFKKMEIITKWEYIRNERNKLIDDILDDET